jgi:galactose mutarotase-like enzyme
MLVVGLPYDQERFATEDCKVPEPRSSWVSLSSAQLRAQIDPLGAQLSTLQDRDGRDLLWDGDPAVWTGRAPLLFPIVGELAGGRYRIGSTEYPLPRHGFARRRQFRLVTATAGDAVFRLAADEATLQVYPFRFELDVRFSLQGAALKVVTSVRNLGTGPLLASFGYHPALRWPLPFGDARSGHSIEFESDEPAPVRRLNTDGLLTPVRYPTPVSGRRLALADELFTNDALIFDALRSRSVTYGAGSGGPRIRVSYGDAPYLGVWSKPGAGFICIEPWHGIADPEGFSGELSEKPGVFEMAAGAERAIQMTIERVAADKA